MNPRRLQSATRSSIETVSEKLESAMERHTSSPPGPSNQTGLLPWAPGMLRAMSRPGPHLESVLALALEEVAGAAIVLDPELRVLASTPEADRLMGGALPLGEHAARLLCGEGPQRPVAEALAEGRAITAEVPRLAP